MPVGNQIACDIYIDDAFGPTNHIQERSSFSSELEDLRDNILVATQVRTVPRKPIARTNHLAARVQEGKAVRSMRKLASINSGNIC